ncbi:MAG: High potential iron-sulfur protein [Paraburkholderia sp.]|uniref:high-potential iron-sulfur protein n=1 Tax=Paraburkholderia sp. TaxID=1926495 RepID=UPI001210CDFC|nr:high-potential iron-sulfur protein [Paraburkholderia sp.]TAM05265.1 MAG: High potential iron-sulfur protein [Paraburkholderia sp.]TAM28709.1 MAG: High potential iron-sulfur protein [Paraburkholderia sp.]
MISKARRVFMIQSIGVCASLAIAQGAKADVPLVDENDAAAKGLGYHANAGTVDAAHTPKYQAGLKCANCRFFKGASNEASGTCPMFPGKNVAAEGWCNVYAKRV